jgi:hypothetical protein
MQPALEDSFMKSVKWQALSPAARCTLQGLLQFATRRHCDWVVEGTPKQIGEWIGPETNIEPSQVVTAIRELSTAGCLRRGRTNAGSAFIVAAPVDDRR